MYADSYFAIGTSHRVCQDYALSGTANNRFFAAVSDGCSSSKHTDFGSRFLCLGTQGALEVSPKDQFDHHAVLPLACSLLGKALPWECLDATLLVTYPTEKLIVAMVAGDGVIAARHRDGTVHTTEIEFSNNAPAYLSYQLDLSRFNTYITGQISTGVVIDGCGVRTSKETVYDRQLAVGVEKEGSPFTDRVSSEQKSFWHIQVFDRKFFDLVAVMSDGVYSFQERNALGQLDTVPLQAVLQQLMQFKRVKGEFVTRRCRRFLGKYCVKHDWSHYDDFSCAAVYVGE